MNLEILFEKYLREYLSENKGIIGQLEDILPKVYAKWTNLPSAELGGLSPRAYVEGVTDPKELADLAFANVRRGGEPAPVVVEKLVSIPSASVVLIDILENDSNEKARISAAELLDRMDKLPLAGCVEIVFDADTPMLLRESLVSRLEYDGDAIKQDLLARIGVTDGEFKKILAQLLVRAGVTDDRVYALIAELLSQPDCLPLACQLLADYGDPRALEPLYDVAGTCIYSDYIEARNAVERLGGDLPLRLNWENDPTYKKIKEDN